MRSQVRVGQGLVVLVGLLLCIASLPATPALAGGDWNDAQINWRTYEAGFAEAKKTNKPICLIFFTEWCPHCQKYSERFHEPEVVERAKQFVMIRLDRDKHPQLSAKHSPDGQYIPRTYFFSAAGELDPSIQAPREQYKYFYDPRQSAEVLAGMKTALEKLK